MIPAGSSTRGAVWASMGVAMVMIAQQLAGKALRDGFFLSHYEASSLPSVMATASVLSIGLVLGAGRLFRRVGPSRVLPGLFALNGVLFVTEWALSDQLPRVTAVALFLHTTSLGAVVVSTFWSVVNERFDPHTAKRVVARVAGGATFGGVIGGLAAWQGASLVAVPTMILGLGGLNLLCALGASRIGGSNRPVAGPSVSALSILEETPYLRQLFGLVSLCAFAAAAYDYVFKSQAAATFTSDADLVSFFALFYLGVSVATFILHALFANRSVRVLGLGVSVALLPGATAGLGVFALFAPGLLSAIVMRGGTAVVESSLYRSGYELLYTPLSPSKKRSTKTLIDVGADKVGAALGGGFAFFVLGMVPGIATQVLLVTGVGVAVVALFTTRALQRGYVETLESSLRRGTLAPEDAEAVDPATAEVVAESSAVIDRANVLRSIEERGRETPELGEALARFRREAAARPATRRTAPARTSGRAPRAPEISRTSGTDGVVEIIEALRTSDVERVTAALRRAQPLQAPVLPHSIALLAEDHTAHVVTPFLARVAPAHTGILLDALLSQRSPLNTRRRVCDVLRAVPTQRTADGFARLLLDDSFEMRFRGAVGLLAVMRANAKVEVLADMLWSVVTRAAEDCRLRWDRRLALRGQLASGSTLAEREELRIEEGLAHVFHLLLCVLDREPLSLALDALAEEGAAQRGTGLEYLDQVLPADLRTTLWPLVVERELSRRALRASREILDDIVERDVPRRVDLEALRQQIEERRRAK